MSVTVREVVRDVVADAAPQEISLLDRLAPLDDAQVTDVFKSQGRRWDTLGFGFAEVAALLTPVVWVVVDEVISRGVGAATDGVVARLRSGVHRLCRRSRIRPQTVPPLSQEQLNV